MLRDRTDRAWFSLLLQRRPGNGAGLFLHLGARTGQEGRSVVWHYVFSFVDELTMTQTTYKPVKKSASWSHTNALHHIIHIYNQYNVTMETA